MVEEPEQVERLETPQSIPGQTNEYVDNLNVAASGPGSAPAPGTMPANMPVLPEPGCTCMGVKALNGQTYGAQCGANGAKGYNWCFVLKGKCTGEKYSWWNMKYWSKCPPAMST